MPKQQGLYFQTTGYTRPKCSRKKPTNNANDTSQRFVEVFKTIFLCFRLPLRRKWRRRAVWTLIKVLRTFLVDSQLKCPKLKKNPFWRLSKSQWSLADKEIPTVMIGQFQELLFYRPDSFFSLENFDPMRNLCFLFVINTKISTQCVVGL